MKIQKTIHLQNQRHFHAALNQNTEATTKQVIMFASIAEKIAPGLE